MQVQDIIDNGDVEQLRSLIPTMNVDFQDENGETILMHAVDAGQIPCVQAILVAGASINLRDSDQKTALERLDVEYRNYVMHGGVSDDMIDVLIEAGADFSRCNSSLCMATIHNWQIRKLEKSMYEMRSENARLRKENAQLHKENLELQLRPEGGPPYVDCKQRFFNNQNK